MKFHNLLLVGLLIGIIACRPLIKESKSKNSSFTQHVLKVDEKRSYWVYMPQIAEINKGQPLPLLFMFHGSKSNGQAFSKAMRFNETAEREKFMVVYPDALVGNWAEGCDCNNADRLKVKDMEFVDAMIEELHKNYDVQLSKIFAAGFSQGGLFVNRLACEMSSNLSGAVVVAATMSVPLSKTCAPKSPIPMTFIQGINDTVLPYSGVQNGPLSLLSAKETARFWANKNDSMMRPEINSKENLEVLSYSSSQNKGAGVTLFSIKGYGHGWPMLESFDTNERIASFISEYQNQ